MPILILSLDSVLTILTIATKIELLSDFFNFSTVDPQSFNELTDKINYRKEWLKLVVILIKCNVILILWTRLRKYDASLALELEVLRRYDKRKM
ncbi:hypothetical protein B1A85_09265 [Chroococcidiopsis sp. TS-821]|nr:hypothetical protein B1A85_09265 [Chroococcidiopsis sp. TS-821]